MADRKAEQGAVQYGQDRWSFENNDSRLAGAGQIANEIRRLVEEGEYTDYVSGLSVKGRLINRMIDVVYWPRKLFAAGELGTWFDPSDMSTLFQDAAGTTPVTAVEQPVSLMLDKSKGLVLGSELVTNGDFSDGTGWTLTGATNSIASGVATMLEFGILSQTGGTFSSGKSYLVECDFVQLSGTASPVIRIGQNTTNDGGFTSGTGRKSTIIRASGSGSEIYFRYNGAGTYSLDNISVKEIAGNHAYTPSTASTSRPTLSARYNLLLATATLATQNVTVTAGDHTLYFTGTGSITLSGTGSGTYNAGTHTITTTAGTLTLTVTGSVLTADLRRANDGVGLPAYQAVVTASNYDASSLWPPFLRFDGSDDYMLTNSINFTGTDKMTVFAGVRKFGTSNDSLASLSTVPGANNGTFHFLAPGSESVGSAPFNNYSVYIRGTAYAGLHLKTYTSPITNVVSFAADISQATISTEISPKVNGQVPTISVSGFAGSDAGTGNFGNYPMYIGRQGGTSNPFNGRLYGLITRGAQSTASEISNTEAWLNAKTKAYA